MSKKNIKLASKFLFVVIACLLLVKIIFMTFEESKYFVQKDSRVYEVSQEEIIGSENEILIKSFSKSVRGIDWISGTELLIDGTMGDESGQFVFDMAAKELIKFKGEKRNIKKDYGQYSFVEEIPSLGDLCILGTEIGLLTQNNEFKVIADDATYDNQVKLVLSDDLSKLGYYHHDKGRIITYSFENGFYRTINVEVAEVVLNDFEKYVQLSPLGGYVSIETRTDEFENSTFYVYGADSGTSYAEEVMGVKLAWSPDDSKLCFYYTKETEKFHTDGSDGFGVKSRRIGYYDIAKKHINYIDSSESNNVMISPIYWSSASEKIYTLTGDQDEAGDLSVDGVLEFELDKNIFSEFALKKSETVSLDSEIDMINYDEAYVLVINSGSAYRIKRIRKDNSETIEFDNLSKMNINDDDNAYYYKDGDALVTADHEMITVTKPNFQGYIHLDGNDYAIYPSSNLDYLVVWFKFTNEIKILNTK